MSIVIRILTDTTLYEVCCWFGCECWGSGRCMTGVSGCYDYDVSTFFHPMKVCQPYVWCVLPKVLGMFEYS